eukprot:2389286-Rhodomonas_salina.1
MSVPHSTQPARRQAADLVRNPREFVIGHDLHRCVREKRATLTHNLVRQRVAAPWTVRSVGLATLSPPILLPCVALARRVVPHRVALLAVPRLLPPPIRQNPVLLLPYAVVLNVPHLLFLVRNLIAIRVLVRVVPSHALQQPPVAAECVSTLESLLTGIALRSLLASSV